ncbi:hypothetical protein BWD14_21035 [Leptospira santarosai]|uniref:Lipoprotein n=1 Tax=Leptospira santarosai TaxID=28183 RepID=A0AB73LKA5_9LEPT|nr:hypothetical protein BWD14_21035 [Leptospira santarosai]
MSHGTDRGVRQLIPLFSFSYCSILIPYKFGIKNMTSLSYIHFNFNCLNVGPRKLSSIYREDKHFFNYASNKRSLMLPI